MHIPDGYLSPQTYIPLYGVSFVFLSVALKKMKKELSTKHVPCLAMASAFPFLIMMFNVPLPGGTSGHAVGAALAGIILGPEAARIAIAWLLSKPGVVPLAGAKTGEQAARNAKALTVNLSETEREHLVAATAAWRVAR